MKTPLPMEPHQAEWVENNLYLFQNANAPTKEQKAMIYAIYNNLYLDTKKVTGCARCWTSVKQYVYASYLRHKNNL